MTRERMARLLLAEEFWWREGRLDTLPYYAFPEVAGDTVAFYPLPGAVMARGGHRPKTQDLALAINRKVLADISTAWVEAFPQDPVAHRALAYALEVSGKIAPIVGERHTALIEMAAAQRLERQSPQRMSDAVATVRLLVKAGQFDAAREAGDSLLRTIRAPTPGVAGVAVLLGRPALAARLVAIEDTSWLHQSADNEAVTLPLSAGLAGLRLGYGIAHPDFITELEKIRQPFNINSLVQAGALAALDDTAHVEKTRRNNARGYRFFARAFRKLGLEFVPSAANFVLVRVGDGQPVFNEMQKLGVIARPFRRAITQARRASS